MTDLESRVAYLETERVIMQEQIADICQGLRQHGIHYTPERETKRGLPRRSGSIHSPLDLTEMPQPAKVDHSVPMNAATAP